MSVLKANFRFITPTAILKTLTFEDVLPYPCGFHFDTHRPMKHYCGSCTPFHGNNIPQWLWPILAAWCILSQSRNWQGKILGVQQWLWGVAFASKFSKSNLWDLLQKQVFIRWSYTWQWIIGCLNLESRNQWWGKKVHNLPPPMLLCLGPSTTNQNKQKMSWERTTVKTVSLLMLP